MALTPKQEAFCLAYLETGNASEAYRRAYSAKSMKPESIHRMAVDVMANVKVASRLRELREPAAREAGVTVSRIVERLALIAFADPRELVEYRRVNCRHCWGEGHGFQWLNSPEWERAVAFAIDHRKPLPDDAGGYGFDPDRTPNPQCPACLGRGEADVFVHDTRRLSPTAAALYAGVKRTKDGIEVKMHNPQDALRELAKIIGAYAPERKEVAATTKTEAVDLTKLSDEALAELMDARAQD